MEVDISGCIRIKCVQCTDFDLCVECFSVGVEVDSHKATHDYQIVVRSCLSVCLMTLLQDRMSFPLFAADWGADEELLLLEALKKYGTFWSTACSLTPSRHWKLVRRGGTRGHQKRRRVPEALFRYIYQFTELSLTCFEIFRTTFDVNYE